MAQDIQVKLDFDYSVDTQFTGYVAPPGNVQIINVANEKDILKQCGWFSGWGKELTGINAGSFGGAALEGPWLFGRGHLTFGVHPMFSEQVPESLIVNFDLRSKKDFLNKRPVVIGITLNGTRMSFLVCKGRVDGANQLAVKLENVYLPFPANASWTSHPGYKKGKTVSNLASARNRVDVGVTLEVVDDLHVIAVVVEDGFGRCSVRVIDSVTIESWISDAMTSCSNPNDAIVKFIDIQSTDLIDFTEEL
jgi:hypothetical protein